MALPAVTLALLGAGCGRRPEPLPVYGQVPAFVLTAQQGKEFRSQELDGKVWVADFIYTSCEGPCPRMSALMRRIQEETRDLPQVRLVSFTVDPARDTPEVMAAYARHYQAIPGRWFFLTGARDDLQQLYRHAFLLGDVDGTLVHSTRFVLVDGRGRIRGFYGTSDVEDIARLTADLRRLATAARN